MLEMLKNFSNEDLKFIQDAINKKLTEKSVDLQSVYKHLAKRKIFDNNVDDCKAFVEVLAAADRNLLISLLMREVSKMLDEKSGIPAARYSYAYVWDLANNGFKKISTYGLKEPSAIAMFKDWDDCETASAVIDEFFLSQK